MKDSDVVAQSKSAYGQWAEQWREHSKIHAENFEMKDWKKEFHYSGVGRVILCVANGYSFEENLPIIKEMADRIDILACDKSLGHLLRAGIKPKFCVMCDANVKAEDYLDEFADQLSETILFANVCGNPSWTLGRKWKEVFFFCNQDVLNSHLEFSKISGCKQFIAAGTNVSNQMVVLLTQSGPEGRQNFFGYDRIVLIGYDYCWEAGKYYAFDNHARGKDYYMGQIFLKDRRHEHVKTSPNLLFSARWFDKYVRGYGLPVVNGSKRTISDVPYLELRKALDYNYQELDQPILVAMLKKQAELVKQMGQVNAVISDIADRHMRSHLATA